MRKRRVLPLIFAVGLVLWLLFGRRLIDGLLQPEATLPSIATQDIASASAGVLLYTQGYYGILQVDLATATVTTLWEPPVGGQVHGITADSAGQLIISYKPPEQTLAGLYRLDVTTLETLQPILVEDDASFGSPTFADEWLYYTRYNQARTYDPLNQQTGLSMQIERLSLTDGRREVVLNDAEQLTFSPDGSHITYLAYHPDVQKHALWMADADGDNAQLLVDETRFNSLQNPRFDPSGAEIIFGASRRLQTQSQYDSIGVAQAHGAPWRLWTVSMDDPATLDDYSLLSFDGPWTAFGPDGNLYVMDAGQILVFGEGGIAQVTETRNEGEMIWQSQNHLP